MSFTAWTIAGGTAMAWQKKLQQKCCRFAKIASALVCISWFQHIVVSWKQPKAESIHDWLSMFHCAWLWKANIQTAKWPLKL